MYLPREQPLLHFFLNPFIPGAPLLPRDLFSSCPRHASRSLTLSDFFSMLSLRPWGVWNSRHSWYAFVPGMPEYPRANMDFWKEKNHRAVNISLMLHKIPVRKTISSSFSDEGQFTL